MRTIASLLLGSAAALALTSTAHATGSGNGWYLSIDGGAVWVDDVDFHVSPIFLDGDADFDTGWAILGAAGYAWRGTNWRTEFELGYRRNDGDNVTFEIGSPVPDDSFDADLSEISLMFNVLYDWYWSDRFYVSLGVGAGADRANLDVNCNDDLIDCDGFSSDDDGDWKFATQAIVGLNYAITPRTDLYLNYRFLHVNGPDHQIAFDDVPFDVDLDDLSKHTVTIGLRFDLSPELVAMPEPPPPPPVVPMVPVAPAPPPVSPKQFIVFFGFNKCNITAEADRVISEAAQAAQTTGVAAIRVVGHTDTVGSPQYNFRLSTCRANAVRTNLVSKGIPDAAITTEGRGETELMVQTGDNIKEPQNRRATIDMR